MASELAKHGESYNSFTDEDFHKYVQDTINVLEQVEWERVSTKNLSLDCSEVDVIASLIETICSACITEERALLLNSPTLWNVFSQLLEASTPTEQLYKFKPEVPQDVMAKLLAAAQRGERLSKEDLAAENPEVLTEEQLKGRELLQGWGRVRRAVLGVLRNALRYPNTQELKEGISNNKKLVTTLAHISADVLEEGVNVSYSFTILRFLITNETSQEQKEYQRFVCAECMKKSNLDFIIGSAVTSRVIHLPDNTKLWVHMEATRFLAQLIMLVPSEELPQLLLSTRALCDGIVATKNSTMHKEMAQSILRLIEECPPCSKKVFYRQGDGTYKSIDLMIEFNLQRVVHSFIGLLVLSTKDYLTQKDEETKENVMLSLRLLKHIAKDCANELMEQNASEIIGTIANAVPEAKDILDTIEANAKPTNKSEKKEEETKETNPDPPPNEKSEQPKRSWFYCPLL